ncbi:hypothetical protein COOONC_16295 [Cooperia oncophora]
MKKYCPAIPRKFQFELLALCSLDLANTGSKPLDSGGKRVLVAEEKRLKTSIQVSKNERYDRPWMNSKQKYRADRRVTSRFLKFLGIL